MQCWFSQTLCKYFGEHHQVKKVPSAGFELRTSLCGGDLEWRARPLNHLGPLLQIIYILLIFFFSLPDLAEDEADTDSPEKSPHYCATCSRSLASLGAFNRHLSSELHFKRSASLLPLSNEGATPRKRIKLLPEIIKEPGTVNVRNLNNPILDIFRKCSVPKRFGFWRTPKTKRLFFVRFKNYIRLDHFIYIQKNCYKTG